MRLRASTLTFVISAFWLLPLHAQQNCPSTRATVTAGGRIEAPAGFDQVTFVNTRTRQTVNNPGPLTDLNGRRGLQVNELLSTVASAFKTSNPGSPDEVQLRWGKTSDPNAECLQPFDVGTPPEQVAQVPVATIASVDVAKCNEEGQKLHARIRNDRKLGTQLDDFSLIVFCRETTAFQAGRDFGVQGDPIYVALYDNGHLQEPHIEFPACSIEKAGPRVFQSEAALPRVGGTQTDSPFQIDILAGPRSCFDTTVSVALKARKTDREAGRFTEVTKSYSLQQRTLYHSTLQVGALFTEQHPRSFGLRTDEENQNRIFDKGPEGRGPEYTAALVVYSLPRQLRRVFGGKPFRGRDILAERKSFADSLGGVIAVGLDEPGDRFAAGLSFELFDYLNLVAVYSWARLPRLSGVEEGEIFLGSADQIPVRDEWEGRFEAGITIDLRYATLLFKK